MGPLSESLARSPELFPFALDLRNDTVTLLRFSRAEFENASFLDGRIVAPGRPGRTLRFADLAEAAEAAGLRERCDFIFHLGHVGSTLLSRLLGRHSAIFSLREPAILRTLAQMSGGPPERYLSVFLKLWSRTFEPNARALVKPTSFVSELAENILSRPCAPRALAMIVAPEAYLATILGGANAPAEARTLAPFRLARLEQRLSCRWRLADMSEGETVALGWACEACALAAATEKAGERALIFDFEQFLADPEAGLARAFAHFGVAATPAAIAQIVSGPDMRSYSKAPEHAYDAALRRAVLDEGRREHGDEIRRGLRWLDRAAHEYPQLLQALELFVR
ncbi:MAG: hypothetical protein ACREHF_00310 [Rhizomicrobium sp.]